MSARPTVATLARRAALWLGLAAAFLPTVIPGLHGGHGVPAALRVAAQVWDSGTSAATHRHDAHSGMQHAAAERDRRDGRAPVPDRPNDGACPICRTLQQIGAFVVPEIALVVARSVPGETVVATTVAFLLRSDTYALPQPRAPPVGA